MSKSRRESTNSDPKNRHKRSTLLESTEGGGDSHYKAVTHTRKEVLQSERPKSNDLRIKTEESQVHKSMRYLLQCHIIL